MVVDDFRPVDAAEAVSLRATVFHNSHDSAKAVVGLSPSIERNAQMILTLTDQATPATPVVHVTVAVLQMIAIDHTRVIMTDGLHLTRQAIAAAHSGETPDLHIGMSGMSVDVRLAPRPLHHQGLVIRAQKGTAHGTRGWVRERSL